HQRKAFLEEGRADTPLTQKSLIFDVRPQDIVCRKSSTRWLARILEVTQLVLRPALVDSKPAMVLVTDKGFVVGCQLDALSTGTGLANSVKHILAVERGLPHSR